MIDLVQEQTTRFTTTLDTVTRSLKFEDIGKQK